MTETTRNSENRFMMASPTVLGSVQVHFVSTKGRGLSDYLDDGHGKFSTWFIVVGRKIRTRPADPMAGLVQDSGEVAVVADSSVTLLEEHWTAPDTRRCASDLHGQSEIHRRPLPVAWRAVNQLPLP